MKKIKWFILVFVIFVDLFAVGFAVTRPKMVEYDLDKLSLVAGTNGKVVAKFEYYNKKHKKETIVEYWSNLDEDTQEIINVLLNNGGHFGSYTVRFYIQENQVRSKVNKIIPNYNKLKLVIGQ